MMNKRKEANGDRLSALTVLGRIMIFVPIGVNLILFISSLLGQGGFVREEGFNPTVIEYNAFHGYLTAGSFLIFLCGLTMLVYVAVKRFRQGLRGEADGE